MEQAISEASDKGDPAIGFNKPISIIDKNGNVYNIGAEDEDLQIETMNALVNNEGVSLNVPTFSDDTIFDSGSVMTATDEKGNEFRGLVTDDGITWIETKDVTGTTIGQINEYTYSQNGVAYTYERSEDGIIIHGESNDKTYHTTLKMTLQHLL